MEINELKKEYELFLPLFTKIDSMLCKGKVTLAIEGGSASGKSTLGSLLKQVYNCPLFHTDDFFLQPHQRTKERLLTPGGNMDRERFLEEILLPVSRGEKVKYQKFNCQTQRLAEFAEENPSNLNIIEGVYSMHPELEGFYNLSVFLDIDEKTQKERILKRNTEEMANRFFSEWIPLEKVYFEKMQILEKCHIKFTINDLT